MRDGVGPPRSVQTRVVWSNSGAGTAVLAKLSGNTHLDCNMPTLKFQFSEANLAATAQYLKRDAATKFGRKSETEIQDFLIEEAVKVFLARYGTRDLDAEAINSEGISPLNLLYRGLIPGYTVTDKSAGGVMREVAVPKSGSRTAEHTFVGVDFWISLG